MTPRWVGVSSRTAAAVLGGYGLAALTASCCAVGLPLLRAEAVLTGMLLGFLVYAGAVLWVFAAGSAWRAWAGLALPGAVLAGLLTLLRYGPGMGGLHLAPGAVVFGLALGGFVALSLSMGRHAEQVLVRRPGVPAQSRGLRVLGWSCLAASALCAILAWPWAFAVVTWVGVLTAAALIVALGLTVAVWR